MRKLGKKMAERPEHAEAQPGSLQVSPFRLVFITVTLAVILTHFLNPALWSWTIGPLHYDPPLYPFLDMHGRLAQMEMHASGFDVYAAPNPIDPMGRINNKPSITLGLGHLGLGTRHLVNAAAVCLAAYLVSVFVLIRPRNWTDAALAILCVTSPPAMLLIERANDDMILFSLLTPVPFLLARKRLATGIFAAGLVALGTMIKLFPAAVFAVFLHRPAKRLSGAAILLGGLVFVAFYAFLNGAELSMLRGRIPSPEGMLTYGAINLPRALGLTEGAAVLQRSGFALVLALALIVFLRSRGTPQTPDRDYAEFAFLLGATLVTFSFFIGTNWDYRAAFFLFTLPGLLKLRASPSRPLRIGATLVATALLPALYVEYLVIAHNFDGSRWTGKLLEESFLIRQILLWLVVGGIVLISARMMGPSVWRVLESGPMQTPNPKE